ncbi:DUF6418 domain-containing protein [Bradyrhizobium diazoefficiens]|uniref:DUF6418 domain-containing protein n=1 Tax=Bradyrhizobium diazoefficiens TaxID=1355477 RepID=UPI002714AF9D|nr:DUF6418 domain-containing protein [Bradyrhizobium diazoefficiens]WLA54296.1 DUF6418 domain-containing protein [Bradyrhizobium diazoefficiens]
MSTSPLTADPVIFALVSVSAACLILTAFVAIALRRPGLVLLSFFVFFAFAWRLCSVLYIDIFGPVFSEQLERDIGPGISALPIALAQVILIVALLGSFRPARLQAIVTGSSSALRSRVSGGRFDLSDAALWIVAFFVIALWIELLARGPVPLFAGMERYDYSRLYGGPLHRLLLDWGAMLAFQLGVFLVAPTFCARPFDWRFCGLFASLILYLFLVGHRFSSLYTYTSFFVIPIGIAIMSRQASQGQSLVSGTVLRYLALGGAVLCVLIVGAVAYSYTVVRAFEGDELFTKLSQRILIQQGEMWWMTYERVFLQDHWNGAQAAYKLFINPYAPDRNSTMQFLMEAALPQTRAHFILDQGSAYTGGWPEVFFELGGPIGGFVLVAASAVIFSEFMFLLTRCVVQERFATCFFLTPVLYALQICIASGMVNSFVQLTFMLKVAMALLVYVAEEKWRFDMLSALPPTHSPSQAFSQKES